MIVSHDTHEVTLSNVSSTGEFKIRNSARAFSILSSGLYSNKIKAIIRELSCNALDSHIASGNTDATFEVHLPSVLEPWFSVRDFGTGLDGDQVTNIYTTYFESTKTGSNDFIGALGLGSKSPFSYTENFTLQIRKGKQTVNVKVKKPQSFNEEDPRVKYVKNIAQRFVKACKGGKELKPSFEQGFRVQELIEKIRINQI